MELYALNSVKVRGRVKQIYAALRSQRWRQPATSAKSCSRTNRDRVRYPFADSLFNSSFLLLTSFASTPVIKQTDSGAPLRLGFPFQRFNMPLDESAVADASTILRLNESRIVENIIALLTH